MIDAYIALMIFIVFMVVTPGPANMVLMIGGAQQGVRACFGFIIGVVCGKLLLNLLFGFGFGLFLADQPVLVQVLKFISAGYMIWLALQSWNSDKEKNVKSKTFTFRYGIIVHPLNPKAWVMVILTWSQFAPGLGSFSTQLLLVVSSFAAVQLIFHTFWCWSGALLQRALPKDLFLTRGMILITVAIVIWALLYDS